MAFLKFRCVKYYILYQNEEFIIAFNIFKHVLCNYNEKDSMGKVNLYGKYLYKELQVYYLKKKWLGGRDEKAVLKFRCV